MDWGTALWDQHDAIDKQTQWGLDLIERYVKFVKERTEIEQNYTKQIRVLCKKYSRRGSREDQEMKFSNHRVFQDLVVELNECAAHREVMAENMNQIICSDLTKYLQEVKQERKSCQNDVKKAQQNLEVSFKQLETSKRRFEKEWKEAEKAIQQAERLDQDHTATKMDVEKAKVTARQKTHVADDCKNEYASQLQKYNKDQHLFYYTEIPSILNRLQQAEERRVRKLAEAYGLMAETEINTLPLIRKNLEKISTASSRTDEKQDSLIFIEQHKSGLAPPADVEFEDYSQGIRSAAVENSHHQPKVRIKQLFKKNKMGGPGDKTMPSPVEDYSHLPREERKKRLQERIDEMYKELQKETDQSEALEKMKRIYVNNNKLGDPTTLEPEINQKAHNIQRLKTELHRYETWLSEAGRVSDQYSGDYVLVNPGQPTPPDLENVYECDFDEDFEEEAETQCRALYDFKSDRDGEVSMKAGECLCLLIKDRGDGWVRVKKKNGDCGYVPASYVEMI